jgi:GT2 family glycosyltransferase
MILSPMDGTVRPATGRGGGGPGPQSSLVTVVLLNYNGRHDLEGCLDSLRSDASRVAVLVADNGSADGSLEWLARAHPWVRTRAYDRNWGFAQGINRALATIDTPYFALLNNDTEVKAGWLDPLVEALEGDPEAAAIQSRIMMFDRRDLVQSAGGGVTSHGYGYDQGYGRPYVSRSDGPQEVFFASAGAALFRRSAWDDVGPFDPAYFMYHEDVDWSWRAWLAGWRILYEPRSVVYHKMGSTTTKVLGFSARQALGERHRIRTLLKLGALPRAVGRIASPLRPRDFRRARLVLRCLSWNLWHLGSTLHLRALTTCRVKREEVERRMHPFPRAPALLASYRPAEPWDLLRGLAAGALSPRPSLEVGADDETWLGLGWHVPETAPKGKGLIRWMAEEGEIYGAVPAGMRALTLELEPWVPPVAGEVELSMLERTGDPAGTEKPWRRLSVASLRSDRAGPVEVKLQAGEMEAGSLVRIRLSFRPVRESASRIGDTRELSVGFCAYRWS